MTIAVDTNILAYAEGANDGARQAKAIEVLGSLPASEMLIPVQVLGELFRILTGKVRRSPAEARLAVLSWRASATLRDTSAAALLSAMDLSADHGLSIWDALILSVAAEAGCQILLSEDLQAGFVWRGVTVVNPLAQPPHPLLDTIIGPQRTAWANLRTIGGQMSGGYLEAGREQPPMPENTPGFDE